MIIINLGKAGRHVLAIRYENKNFEARDELISQAGISIQMLDANKAMRNHHFKIQALSLLLLPVAFSFFTLFGIHLLSYIFNSKERPNLLFALFSICMGLTVFGIYALFYVQSIDLLERITFISIACGIIGILLLSILLNTLFGRISLKSRV